MTSFIIVSRDKDKRVAYSKEFCTKQHLNPFDIALIEKDTAVKQNVASIGIEDVKQIQKTIFLKPLKSKQKAVIIEDAHLLTTEAQNALLKVLEEPPEHTLLLLCTKSKDDLLPTILSRCQIIEIETDTLELTTRERNSINQFIGELPTMTVGDKLKRAELLAKDKEKAIDWIEKLIIIYREKLLSSVILVIHQPEHQEALSTETLSASEQVSISSASQQVGARMTKHIRLLQELHTTLKTTNINLRFALENTLLSL